MLQQFRPERLFTGQTVINNPIITINNGMITAISASDDKTKPGSKVIELAGLLAPGYIDVQVNGGAGLLFNHAPSLNTLIKMSWAHSQFGTTGFLPTLITDDIQIMQQAADAVALALKQNIPGILGIHFEGPHLSTPKKGVHPKRHIRPISEAEWALYARQDLGIKMLTLAPENIQTEDITRLQSLGWLISLGHSNADSDCVKTAIKAGANGFTHLFNAMSPLTSREPGMVGTALTTKDTYCGIILDHHHVHPDMVKLAYQLKGADKLILVTDAMALVGSEHKSFQLFDEKVTLDKDKLTIATGQLAGSHLTMQQALKNAMFDLEIPLNEVLKMASSSPANWLKQNQNLGKIEVGYKADWVQLDEQLTVINTWIGGQSRLTCFTPWLNEL